MAALQWDQVNERLYETGVDQGVLYPYNTEYDPDTDDTPYDTGYAWNGITGVTMSPSGAEPTSIWADNSKYLTLMSAEETGGTITAYMYPDQFAECDGSATLKPGLTAGQQPRKTFGLVYRTRIGNDTELDQHGYKLHLVYGCLASPSERAYATVNDSPEAIEFSWEFSCTPAPVTGFKPTAELVIDSTKADATKLAALEKVLFGDTNTDASLPLPDDIVTALTPATSGGGVG